MLYKILDMLQTIQIKFVFIATTMAYDIVDQFEKRIKSRFSHRSVLLYDETFDVFRDELDHTFQSMTEQYEDKESLKLVH